MTTIEVASILKYSFSLNRSIIRKQLIPSKTC